MLREAAHEYADQGWEVFPLHWIDAGRCSCGVKCGSPGKHPKTKSGVLDATVDHDQIDRWWEDWPRANVGIATGPGSNLWVLDIDSKHSVEIGEGVISEGEHSLRRLEDANDRLPDTKIVYTPSGGWHYYFQYPDLTNQWGNRSGIRPSIDGRGYHGYVVAPPSIGITGHPYKWVEAGIEVSEMPTWLLSVLKEDPKSTGLRKLGADEKIKEGEGRHDHLFKYGAMLRGVHAIEGNALLGALRQENLDRLVPPLLKYEVEHIFESVSKFAPNQAPPEHELDLEFGEADESVPLPPIQDGQDMPDLLIDLLLNPPPPPEPLIDGILNTGEGGIIGSVPNLGKSWLAFHMGLSVASGTPFLGRFNTHQGPVLYIDEEGSRYNDYSRLQMLLDGSDVIGSAQDVPFYLSVGKSLRLDKREGITAIRRMIERIRPKLVIFDAMVRFHRADENNAQSMAEFFDIAKRLQNTYGCTCLFLHHLRKSGVNDDPLDPSERFRGSGDIQGWADFTAVLQRGADGSELQFVNTKQRNGIKHDPFSVRLLIDHDKGTARLGYLGEVDKTSQATSASSRLAAVLEAITAIEIEGGKATAEAIAVKVGRPAQGVKELCKGLVQSRQIDDYLFKPEGGSGRALTAYRRREGK